MGARYVLGTSGTAGLIRVMRNNLLDELSKPYVVTARAKGMRPLRAILKTVVGTLVSDILLAVVDPRIKYTAE